MAGRIVITIKEFADVAQTKLLSEESIVFEDEGIEALKEIHKEPVEAIMLALQLATKVKKYADSRGRFAVRSQKMKGEFDVDQWAEK